jgi:SSS family solute:Na+ symporter
LVDFTALWSGADWVVMMLYFVGVVTVGFVMKKRASKNMKSFFVASRRLTIPVLIGVAAAGWYDSWTIVGLAECGWTMGISIMFIYVIPTGILRLPLAIWIGPKVRDRIPDWVVTMPDLFEYLYDRKSKFAVGISMLTPILYESALLTAGGQVIHFVTGINIWIAMGILGIIIVLYTSLSGMWGLAVTDLIQFAIMTVSAGMLCFGILSTYGGLDGVYESIRAADPKLLTPLGHNSLLDAFSWVIAAGALYANSQSYQRFGSSKSGADIKVSYTLMLFFGMCFSAVMVLAGMVASVHFSDAASPAEGFWGMTLTVLPVGLRGLFVAALLAAVMSTVSADFLIVSTVVIQDLYRSFINKKMSERNTIIATRVVIWFFGIAIIGATYFWQEGIDKAYYYIGGFQVAAFFIPLLLGITYKRRTPAAGFYSVVLSVAFYFVWQFALNAPFGIPTNVAAWVFSAVIYLVIANLTYRQPERLSPESDREINERGA